MRPSNTNRRKRVNWKFLTNHSHVLICVMRNPNLLVKEIAQRIGITERAAQSVLRDLEDSGYVEVRREGRRNRYKVHSELPLRHPLYEGHSIGEFLEILAKEDGVDTDTGEVSRDN